MSQRRRVGADAEAAAEPIALNWCAINRRAGHYNGSVGPALAETEPHECKKYT